MNVSAVQQCIFVTHLSTSIMMWHSVWVSEGNTIVPPNPTAVSFHFEWMCVWQSTWQMHLVRLCVCAAPCTWRRSLQGSDRLQHALQFTTVVKRRHIAATSDTLLTDEHTRDLHSHLDKKTMEATGKCEVTDFNRHTGKRDIIMHIVVKIILTFLSPSDHHGQKNQCTLFN